MIQDLQNRFLIKIEECNSAEYEDVKAATHCMSYNYITKKSYASSYLLNYRFIPSGFWQKMLLLGKDKGYQVKIKNLNKYIVDKSISKDDINEWINNHDFALTPRWFQFHALFLALKYRVSRVEIGTGGGKTFIQYLYARYIIENVLDHDMKVLIVVPRRSLVTQTIRDFKKHAIDDFIKCDSEFSGGVRFMDSNVVVGTFQTLSNYEREYFQHFGAVMIDESHTGATESVRSGIMLKLNPDVCMYRYGLSATQPDEGTISGLDVEAYLGPILFKVPAIDLVNEHSITKLEFITLRIKYSKEKSKSLFFTEGYDVQGGNRLWIEREWMRENVYRNEIIKKITSSVNQNQLFLVESVEYVHALHNLLSTITGKTVVKIYGGVKDSDRDYYFNLTENNDNIIMVATYGTMYMGVSIDNIHYVHFPDGGKSKTRIKQGFGRGMRLHKNKEKLIVFDYCDELTKQYTDEEKGLIEWPGPKTNIFYRHSIERQKICKSEGHDMKSYVMRIN